MTVPNCTAWAWVGDGVDVAGEHDFATPITWWCPDASVEVLRHAAIEAHRMMRWDPAQAAVHKADAVWRRRAG